MYSRNKNRKRGKYAENVSYCSVTPLAGLVEVSTKIFTGVPLRMCLYLAIDAPNIARYFKINNKNKIQNCYQRARGHHISDLIRCQTHKNISRILNNGIQHDGLRIRKITFEVQYKKSEKQQCWPLWFLRKRIRANKHILRDAEFWLETQENSRFS